MWPATNLQPTAVVTAVADNVSPKCSPALECLPSPQARGQQTLFLPLLRGTLRSYYCDFDELHTFNLFLLSIWESVEDNCPQLYCIHSKNVSSTSLECPKCAMFQLFKVYDLKLLD